MIISIELFEKFKRQEAEIARLRERLGEAEKVFLRCRTALVAFMNHTLVDDIDLLDDIQAFLTPAQPTELTVSKSVQKRVNIQSGGECVAVRRDDLAHEVSIVENMRYVDQYHAGLEEERHNRLKDVLEGKP